MSVYLLALAILPTILILVYVNKMDYHDKEPLSLLLKLFAIGGVPVVIVALIVELIEDAVLGAMFSQSSLVYYFLEAFLVAAVSEEAAKLLFLKLATWRHKAFDYKYDGIIYAVTVSLGFATVENLEYVFLNGGGLSTALSRAVTAIPGHATFGVFMGYFYGLAKMHYVRGEEREYRKARVMCFLVPVLIHGFYDFCCFVGNIFMTLIFLIFIIVIDVLAVMRINRSAKENELIYKQFVEIHPSNLYITPLMAASAVHTPFTNSAPSYGAFRSSDISSGISDRAAARGRNSVIAPGMVPNMKMPERVRQGYAGRPVQPRVSADYMRGQVLQYSNMQLRNMQTGMGPYRQARGPVSSMYPRFIYCPECGAITNTSSFRCTTCGEPINLKNNVRL